MSTGPSVFPASVTCSTRIRKFSDDSFAGVQGAAGAADVKSSVSAQRVLDQFAPVVVMGAVHETPRSQLRDTARWLSGNARSRTCTPTNPISGVYTSSSRNPPTTKDAPERLLRATFAERVTCSDSRVQLRGSPPSGCGKGTMSFSAFVQPAHPDFAYSVWNDSLRHTCVCWSGGWNNSPR